MEKCNASSHAWAAPDPSEDLVRKHPMSPPQPGSTDPSSSNTRVVQSTSLLVKVCLLISNFMVYLRQKRMLKNWTFPLQLTATMSVRPQPFGELQQSQDDFLVNSAQMSFLLIKVVQQRRKAGNSHLHGCRSLQAAFCISLASNHKTL